MAFGRSALNCKTVLRLVEFLDGGSTVCHRTVASVLAKRVPQLTARARQSMLRA
jgi:hypothetical protein